MARTKKSGKPIKIIPGSVLSEANVSKHFINNPINKETSKLSQYLYNSKNLSRLYNGVIKLFKLGIKTQSSLVS